MACRLSPYAPSWALSALRGRLRSLLPAMLVGILIAPSIARAAFGDTPFDTPMGDYFIARNTLPTRSATSSIAPWTPGEYVGVAPNFDEPGALTARLERGPTYVNPSHAAPFGGTFAEPTVDPLVGWQDEGSAFTPGSGSTEGEVHRPGRIARWLGPGCREAGALLWSVPVDYRNFYSLRSLAWLGGGVGVAAIIANTPADESFQNWYDGKIKSHASDSFTDDIRWMGRGQYMIPIFVTAGLVLTPFEERWPVARGVGQWGRRTTRGFLVGAPMLIVLQYTLGPGRPSEGRGSHWQSFNDSHGASGDAFIGALVFMSAAKEVDQPWAKAALYAASIVPAFGRVNDDRHYFSQAMLGVWLAAVTVSAVDLTERSTTTFVVPYAEAGAVGGRIGWRW